MNHSLFAADVPAPPRPGVYRTVMADPPWNEAGAGQVKRGADRHYPLMKTREICALPVSEWAAADAHLYLWVTNNFLPDGLEVMKAWGFRFVTKIDWFKGDLGDVDHDAIENTVGAILANHVGDTLTDLDVEVMAPTIARSLLALDRPDARADEALQIGLGQYFRGCTESCLFGVRGAVEYRTLSTGKRAQGRTGFHAPRGEHSAKPESFRAVVERVSHGPFLEMFARRAAPGWDLWGNQAPSEAA